MWCWNITGSKYINMTLANYLTFPPDIRRLVRLKGFLWWVPSAYPRSMIPMTLQCQNALTWHWLITWHWLHKGGWGCKVSQIARFMGPTWGPPGDDRTQVGPMMAPWTLLFGILWWAPSAWPRPVMPFNTLRPRQNGRHFPDDIFKCIFLFENVWIWINISLKFVHKVRINNIPALVQIMAWCRIGDKPLSEPMMVNSLTHICVTRPQWVNLTRLKWVNVTLANFLAFPS